MRSYFEYILEAVESKDCTIEQREKALKALFDLFQDINQEIGDEYFERIMDVFMMRRENTNESCITNAEFGVAMKYFVITGSDCLISRMIDHENAMPFIFDSILSDDDQEHYVFAELLDFLVDYADASDRMTLMIRYFSGLRNAMFSIVQRGGDMRALFESGRSNVTEVIGVVCTLPSYCEWLSQRLNEPGIPDMIIHAFKTTLDSPRTLQMLLGYGLLKVSQYYANLPNQTGVRAANVFSAILTLHPEWNQKFRRWTCDGEAGNPTAVMGRSIVLTPSSEGTLYIFIEEDDEI